MRYILYFLFVVASLSSPAFCLEPAKVLRVVDGDTLKVMYHGKKESVRLIGVDAPESSDNAKLERDSHHDPELKKSILQAGKAATRYTQGLVHDGETVQLDFDQEKRDKYHRLLAYVYSEKGVFLNEVLLKSGHAVPMTIPPNTKFAVKFRAIYQALAPQE